MIMIKIAHIATAYQSVISILDAKLRLLDEFDDLEITVISSPPKILTCRKPAVRNLQIQIARNINLWEDLKSIWKLYKILKSEKFDIVHSHTAKAGFIAAIAAKMAKVPFICHTYHGLPFFDLQNKIAYQKYRCLEKLACKFRDYILTQNERDMPECVKLMGNKNKVLFEGNGVYVELVQKLAADQLRKAVDDYPCEGIRLAILSRLEPIKRVHDFLEIVAKLKQDGLQISCVIAGFGILEEQLKRQLAEMQLEHCVNMVGFSERAFGIIAYSDIIVLCSEKEGIPRAVMEAMALQKPVVATDVLGTQEVVVDGKTGFLAPLSDIKTMADKIKLLANNAGLRNKMGTAGLARIKEHYNDRKISKFLYNFYVKKLQETNYS